MARGSSPLPLSWSVYTRSSKENFFGAGIAGTMTVLKQVTVHLPLSIPVFFPPPPRPELQGPYKFWNLPIELFLLY